MAVPNSTTTFNLLTVHKVSKFPLLLLTVLYENAFGLGLGTCDAKHGN